MKSYYYLLLIVGGLILVSPQMLQDSYGAEILHYYEENITCSSTSTDSTALLTVTDSTDFDFINGRKYLVMASGQFTGDSASENIGLKVTLGGTDIAGSEHNIEPVGVNSGACGNNEPMYDYQYFSVFTSDGTDTIEIKSHLTGTDTLWYDNLSIFVMEISEDLTENTDWFYDEQASVQTLGTAWNTPDDPTITFTPANNLDDWLVLGTATMVTGSTNKVYETRLNWSGGTDFPTITQEGEDTFDDRFVHTFSRVLSLPNTSQTIETENQRESGGGGIHQRTYGSIFAINLSVFDVVSYDYTESSTTLGTTEYGNNVATLDITPTTTGDVFVLFTSTNDAVNGELEARLQVEDNVSVQNDEPTGQTGHSYDFNTRWDPIERLNFGIMTVENLNTNTHTIDIDASSDVATLDIYDKSLTAFTLELASTTAPIYNIDLMDVYEAPLGTETTLDSGTSVCLNVDTDSADTCGTNLLHGSNYRIEIEVDNTGDAAGSPTDMDYLDLVATGDVLGSILVGDVLDYGCGVNTDWTGLSIATGDVLTSVGSGTACSIPATTGTVEYWFIVTTDVDAGNGTGTFFVDDGSVSDTSFSSTTFTLDPIPIFTSSSRTNAGTIILTYTENVDVTTTGGQGFAVAGGTVTGNTDPAGSGNIITLTITGIPNTGTTPLVTYTQATGTTLDGEGQEQTNSDTTTPQDDAPPTIVSSDFTTLTTMDVVFSENVDTTTTSGEGYAITSPSGTVTGNTDPADVSDTITLTISGITDTAATPTVTYTIATGTTVDASAQNNEVGNGETDVATDSVTPTFTADRTGDNTIVLTFSENVDTTTTSGEGYAATGGTVTGNTDPGAISTIMTLTTSGITDTAATPTVTYTIATGTTDDVPNNEVADTENAVATDSVAPVITVTFPTSSSSITDVTTASSDVSFSFSEVMSAGQIDIVRTGGTADGNSHTCTILGTGLSNGAHNNFDMDDLTNGCTTDEVVDLVVGSEYRFDFDGTDANSNVASQVQRTVVTWTVSNPAYTINNIDVYESESTTLNSGNAVCTGVTITCNGMIIVGHTYRFEVNVSETAGANGTPLTLDIDSSVADYDVLGNIVAAQMIDSGCSTNTDWTESVVSTDARATSGTGCTINSSSADFWMIIRISSDAGSGANPTATFTIDDGSFSDTSGAITFSVDNIGG